MFIQYGIINFKYLFLFLSPLFNATREFFKENDDKLNPFFITFTNFLSLILCGSMFFISEYLTKSDKKEKNNISIKNNQIEGNKNSLLIQIIISKKKKELENKKKKEKKKFFFLLLLSSIQMTAEIAKKHFRSETIEQFKYSLLVLVELLFSIIFSLIFLNFSIYKHQYISFGIFCFCHIIFFVQTILNLNLTTIKFFKSFLYFYTFEKTYCLMHVLGKKYLDTFNDGVYLFLFKVGIIGLPPLLLYDFIANLCGLGDKYHGIIKTLFHNFKVWNFVIELFYSMIADIGIWLTINYFSPCHYIILEITKNILNLSINLIKNRHKELFSKEELLVFYLLYPLIIFDVLIFNEILILNVCGLSDNTRINILKRERLDFKIPSNRLTPNINGELDQDDILDYYEEESY